MKSVQFLSMQLPQKSMLFTCRDSNRTTHDLRWRSSRRGGNVAKTIVSAGRRRLMQARANAPKCAINVSSDIYPLLCYLQSSLTLYIYIYKNECLFVCLYVCFL